MCGIFGIVAFSDRNIISNVISGLKRLEYRGYDSAGVGFLAGAKLQVIKNAGKIGFLEEKVKTKAPHSRICISHTRWATHGAPTSINAHPVQSKNFALVMNGIVENFQPLKKKLIAAGYKFNTDTDTEVVVMLLQHHYDKLQNIKRAIRQTLASLEGRFALLFISNKSDDLYCVRAGAPIVIGRSADQFSIASDSIALSGAADEFHTLQDGEIWQLSSNGEIIDLAGKKQLSFTSVLQDNSETSKGEFTHFMLKEIFESGAVVERILQKHAHSPGTLLNTLPKNLLSAEEIVIVACGTSYNAGIVAKYLIEENAGVRVSVCVASEFRYQPLLYPADTLFVFISQSGETADTLAALEYVKENDFKTLALVNVTSSSIAKLADYAMDIAAGVEIGVASTKAFIAQCTCLLLLNLKLMQQSARIEDKKISQILHELADIGSKIDTFLKDRNIIKVAQKFAKSDLILFIGRAVAFPLALEGALKFKEITYKFSEGLPAGELKHGPIALIDSKTYVVVINPENKLHAKTLSNMEEVKARGANVCLLSSDTRHAEHVNDLITIPAAHEFISPILYAIPLQLIAYYAADYLKLEIDQPRNLAKSVTVE